MPPTNRTMDLKVAIRRWRNKNFQYFTKSRFNWSHWKSLYKYNIKRVYCGYHTMVMLHSSEERKWHYMYGLFNCKKVSIICNKNKWEREGEKTRFNRLFLSVIISLSLSLFLSICTRFRNSCYWYVNEILHMNNKMIIHDYNHS